MESIAECAPTSSSRLVIAVQYWPVDNNIIPLSFRRQQAPRHHFVGPESEPRDHLPDDPIGSPAETLATTTAMTMSMMKRKEAMSRALIGGRGANRLRTLTRGCGTCSGLLTRSGLVAR